MYLPTIPRMVQWLLPSITWRLPSTGDTLYLSFDDGPHPEITPWVYAELRRCDAKATFFCVGRNLERHRHIMEQGLAEGHAFGNHTYDHLAGWSSRNEVYFRNVEKCNQIRAFKLFRPPHGEFTLPQIAHLKARYEVIMWDVLSGDFDPSTSPEKCLRNVLDHAGPGSIVVFHDTEKAERNLRYCLPRVLAHYAALGYRFAAIPEPAGRESGQ